MLPLKRPCSLSRTEMAISNPKFGVYIIYIYLYPIELPCLFDRSNDKDTTPKKLPDPVFSPRTLELQFAIESSPAHHHGRKSRGHESARTGCLL